MTVMGAMQNPILTETKSAEQDGFDGCTITRCNHSEIPVTSKILLIWKSFSRFIFQLLGITELLIYQITDLPSKICPQFSKQR